MTEESRPQTASKSKLINTSTSIGRFYEKRQQLDNALEQYSKALEANPDDTVSYIDRSRVFLKMGSIDKAQEDTDLALNLIDRNSNLLFYYVCVQKAEVLYANGEFELALMYFHRANKVKPGQQICLEGIRKTTEILHCTICNPNIHLTITNNNNNNNLIENKEKDLNKQINLLNRQPIRKQINSIESPLTKYTDEQANQLLVEIANDRKLLINLYTDKQDSAGFTGLDKAKNEAHQTISVLESQLKFLDKAECLHTNKKTKPKRRICTPDMDRTTLTRIAEKELIFLQKLSCKEKSIEILYRSMKIINCLQPSDNTNNSFDHRTRLMLAEAYRLVSQSYNELKLFDQSLANSKQVHEILLPLKDDNCLYRSLYDIGHNLILVNKYSEAIEIFHDMLNKTTTDNERSFVCRYISDCYLNLNNYDQAKKYAYESIDYATKSNDELLLIESYILLGQIYLKLKDYQHAQEYILYAQKFKDQLGDLNQMKYFDELINEIQNSKEKISLLKQNENNNVDHINQQWISSVMQEEERRNKQRQKCEYQFNEQVERKSTMSNWRILIPYYQLFDICTEQEKQKKS